MKKKTAIVIPALSLSVALLFSGCATEYPAEAYENHPIGDVFTTVAQDMSSRWYHAFYNTDMLDYQLALVGAERKTENELSALLGTTAEYVLHDGCNYWYIAKSITVNDTEYTAPIVFAIPDTFSQDGGEVVCGMEDLSNESPRAMLYTAWPVYSYQYLQDGNEMRLITRSSLVVISSLQITTGLREYRAYESFDVVYSPYFENAAQYVLESGNRLPDDIRVKTVEIRNQLDGGKSVCSIDLPNA